jgi:hypothetical protein
MGTIKISKDAEYNRNRIVHLAKKYIGSKSCPKCKAKKSWKIVPLFEYGDPFMPSKVVITCSKCFYNETYCEADKKEAAAWAKDMAKKGFAIAPKSKVESLIIKP